MQLETRQTHHHSTTFGVESFMERAGQDILRGIRKMLAEEDGEETPSGLAISHTRLQQTVLKTGDRALVLRLTVADRSFIVKAFDPTRADSDWRLDRECTMLRALKNLDLAPKLIAYQEVHKCLMIEDIEGQPLSSYVTEENLDHVAYRLGTWFRVLTDRTPTQPKETDWKTYLENYSGLWSDNHLKQFVPVLGNLPIRTFTPSKNDAFLDNFILRTEDQKLIGIDFESATLKPVGWDLLVMARSLTRHFPDKAASIAAHLVGGWGSEVDGIPATDFSKFAQVFAKLTAHIDDYEAPDSAQDFFDAYMEHHSDE